MIFAVGGFAVKLDRGTYRTEGFTRLVDFGSKHEAIGFAVETLEKQWPAKDGWTHRHCVTSELYRKDPDSSGWIIEENYEVDWLSQSL